MPMMDTAEARGAQSWEQNQIYAPYLLVENETVYDFYNANSGRSEQIGVATLPLNSFPGIDLSGSKNPAWKRSNANPIVRNGPSCVHQAADPKVLFLKFFYVKSPSLLLKQVYWDKRLDGGRGAWVMFYFGTDPAVNRGLF